MIALATVVGIAILVYVAAVLVIESYDAEPGRTPAGISDSTPTNLTLTVTVTNATAELTSQCSYYFVGSSGYSCHRLTTNITNDLDRDVSIAAHNWDAVGVNGGVYDAHTVKDGPKTLAAEYNATIVIEFALNTGRGNTLHTLRYDDGLLSGEVEVPEYEV